MAASLGGRLAGMKWTVAAGIAAVAVVGWWTLGRSSVEPVGTTVEPSATAAKPATANSEAPFKPNEAQWKTLTVEPVVPAAFRALLATDGKIAIDDDHTTPIFSPYAGRVAKLNARAGDEIKVNQLLFTVAANDMVQAQNDLIAAITGLNKSRTAFDLNKIKYNRYKTLVAERAAALKDYQEAEANFAAAKNDVQASETSLEAVRGRMRILGKTDAEIADFEKNGKINSETPIFAPLSGTVVARKVGPGQLVGAASTDPVFIVGDLSIVWLVANVRESDSPKVKVGQDIEFQTLSLGDRVFKSKITYVSTIVDSNTRRLVIRAEIDNKDNLLKPEMFAIVSIVTSAEEQSLSVPRSAVIYEGDTARVWIANKDKSVELRKIKTGLANATRVQVLSGLANGDQVVTKGSLFIDRIASGQ